MRILCVIPHYFRPKPGNVQNNSLRAAARSGRIAALTETIASLHRLYGRSVVGIDHSAGLAWQQAPSSGTHVDVIVCTIGNDHLLDELPIASSLYQRALVNIEPELLGFSAHHVLGMKAGQYDYYCFIEDDVAMVDPLFFRKRALFDEQFGPEALLQPNRYETNNKVLAFKAYVDYRLHEVRTAPYQDLHDQPLLEMPFLGEAMRFERSSYPAAGSFFLNARQLERWMASPGYMDFDVSFIGTLDSASTLSVMKAFRIYKPVLDQAWFLEVEHLSPRWVDTVGREVPVRPRTTPFEDLPEHAFGEPVQTEAESSPAA